VGLRLAEQKQIGMNAAVYGSPRTSARHVLLSHASDSASPVDGIGGSQAVDRGPVGVCGGVDRYEVAVAQWCVDGDEVLEVEEVRVLSRGHHDPGRVDQLIAAPITMGEHDKGPPDTQQMRRYPGGEVCRTRSAVIGDLVRGDAGDDQIHVRDNGLPAVGAARGLLEYPTAAVRGDRA
jgi:hypothetical protein